MTHVLDTARDLAQKLAAQRVDVNEVENILAYARHVRDSRKVKKMLYRLAHQDVIIYSRRTKGYIKAIQRTVGSVLPSDPDEALHLLGWTARLMRYERARTGRR